MLNGSITYTSYVNLEQSGSCSPYFYYDKIMPSINGMLWKTS